MKKSIGKGTFALPSPVWIVGTYDQNGNPNMMTAAWGGICCSKPPCIYVSLRKATYSYQNILDRKAFTVSIPNEKYWKEADYVGVVSGRNTDKFKETKLKPIKSQVDAPYVEQYPLIIECHLKEVVDLGLHTMFIGEIIDVKANIDILTNNRPDMQKIKPILFSSGDRTYHRIGSKISKAFTQRNLPTD